MAISPEQLARAKDGRRQAVIAVAAEYYPLVHRVAYALCGQERTGRAIVGRVIRQSLKAMRKWKHSGDPQRWYLHHSVLSSRQKAGSEMDLADDPLIRGVETNSAYYPAFIRALRTLPMQQRESYILYHGEHLDVRGLAIAMDCSQEAAANHLREATAALSAYGGDFYPTFTAHLTQTYERLTPDEELVLPGVKASLRSKLWPARVAQLVVVTIKLIIIGGVVFVGWKIVPMLRW